VNLQGDEVIQLLPYVFYLKNVSLFFKKWVYFRKPVGYKIGSLQSVTELHHSKKKYYNWSFLNKQRHATFYTNRQLIKICKYWRQSGKMLAQSDFALS